MQRQAWVAVATRPRGAAARACSTATRKLGCPPATHPPRSMFTSQHPLTASSRRKGCGHSARVVSLEPSARVAASPLSATTCHSWLRAKPCCVCMVRQVCRRGAAAMVDARWEVERAQRQQRGAAAAPNTHSMPAPTCIGPSMPNWGKQTGTPPRMARGGANAVLGDTHRSSCPSTFQLRRAGQ